MNWSDATKPPSDRTLRQFAVLVMIFVSAIAGWRGMHGGIDFRTEALIGVGVLVGGLGLLMPQSIRLIYTGWMIAAFPIGWVVSRVMLLLLFALLFTPIALVFRLMGRDALKLRRTSSGSYWLPRQQPSDVREYFRQS